MMKLTKYEQSAFTIAYDGAIVAIDFGGLSPESTVQGIGKVNAIYVSHIHPDHFHVPHLETLAAPVHGPRDMLAKVPADLAGQLMSHESSVVTNGLHVMAFLSDHGELATPIENLGFLLSAQGVTIGYLGDMAVATSIPDIPIDVLLVPVGGGKVFDPHQASEFVHTLGYCGLVVPVHYHGRANPESARLFAEAANPFCAVQILGVGESLEVGV